MPRVTYGVWEYKFSIFFLKHNTDYIEMYTYPQLIGPITDAKIVQSFIVKVALTFLLTSVDSELMKNS